MGIRQFWRQYWDRGLLGALVLSMALMVLYLLIPAPEYRLVLEKPVIAPGYVASVQPVTSQVEAVAGDTGRTPSENPSYKRHLAKRHAPKKKLPPPVININTATAAQFDLLPGIGPKIAQRIIQYRKQHGPFAEVAQLEEVQGIGPKSLEKLRPYVKVR